MVEIDTNGIEKTIQVGKEVVKVTNCKRLQNISNTNLYISESPIGAENKGFVLTPFTAYESKTGTVYLQSRSYPVSVQVGGI